VDNYNNQLLATPPALLAAWGNPCLAFLSGIAKQLKIFSTLFDGFWFFTINFSLRTNYERCFYG
jgi:hypothetical protein